MRYCITPTKAAQYTSEPFPAPNGRPWHRMQHETLRNVWDNVAMERFFTLKAERRRQNLQDQR
jgi:hypothetical protein